MSAESTCHACYGAACWQQNLLLLLFNDAKTSHTMIVCCWKCGSKLSRPNVSAQSVTSTINEAFPGKVVVLRNTILVWLSEPAGCTALLENSRQQHKHSQLLLSARQG
jgi:hypothetical protein